MILWVLPPAGYCGGVLPPAGYFPPAGKVPKGAPEGGASKRGCGHKGRALARSQRPPLDTPKEIAGEPDTKATAAFPARKTRTGVRICAAAAECVLSRFAVR